MRSVEQTAQNWWGWMATEQILLASAYQGMTIAGVFAFIILLIAT